MEKKKKGLFMYSWKSFAEKNNMRGGRSSIALMRIFMQNHNFSTFPSPPKLTTSYSLKKVIDENDGWNDISTLCGTLLRAGIYRIANLQFLSPAAFDEICNPIIFCDTVNEAL